MVLTAMAWKRNGGDWLSGFLRWMGEWRHEKVGIVCGGEVLVAWMNLVSWGNGFEGVGIVDKVRLVKVS